MQAFTKLISWSNSEYQNLPWRKKRSLYHTLVSEIMLQQTTVGTVIKHFDRFVIHFPSLESLAKSSEAEVTLHWSGLGYYRRARNLLAAAQFIHKNYEGKIPLDFETLISIPGIGPYTANALRAIGANQKALGLDANLERVLARVYGLKIPWGVKLKKELTKLYYDNFFPSEFYERPREIHESLMDLGRNFCLARSTRCQHCPLNSICQSYLNSSFDITKEQKTNKKPQENLGLMRFIIKEKKSDKILGAKRKKGQWLEGQIEIPTFIYYSQDKKLKQYPLLVLPKNLKSTQQFISHITKYKIKNRIIYCSLGEFKKIYPDFSPKEWDYFDVKNPKNHFSTATLKTLKMLSVEETRP